MTYQQDVETLREMVRAARRERDALYGPLDITDPCRYPLGLMDWDQDQCVRLLKNHPAEMRKHRKRIAQARRAVVKYSPKPFLVSTPQWKIELLSLVGGVAILAGMAAAVVCLIHFGLGARLWG